MTTTNIPPDYESVQKFGRLPDIDAGQTNEDVWDGEGAYSFLSEATALTVSSSSTDDTAAGTGARTVRVVGLDASWNEIAQDVTLNGQSGVSLSTSLIRVYRAYLLTTGTGEVNAGNIWVGSGAITDGVPANKSAGILAGNGQTLMAIYTIPVTGTSGAAFSNGRIIRWYATCSAAKTAYATVALQTREFGQGWRSRRVAGTGEGGFLNEDITWGINVGPKADVRVRVLVNGENNSAVEAGFDVALMK